MSCAYYEISNFEPFSLIPGKVIRPSSLARQYRLVMWSQYVCDQSNDFQQRPGGGPRQIGAYNFGNIQGSDNCHVMASWPPFRGAKRCIVSVNKLSELRK